MNYYPPQGGGGYTTEKEGIVFLLIEAISQ